jgi:uncharacterized protein
VIDVQTHYISDNVPGMNNIVQSTSDTYRMVRPDWWKGMEGLAGYNFGEYIRCVYLESDVAVAVLSSAPLDAACLVPNEEMVGARHLMDSIGYSGRLLNHTVIDPSIQDQLDSMEDWADRFGTAAWKVYTLGAFDRSKNEMRNPWMLDDEVGRRFLDYVRESGVKRVCAHKGLAPLVDTGSPRDIGPAAVAYPDVEFLVYHSGYEFPYGEGSYAEGEYTTDTSHQGVNRLITSLREAGVRPGQNVYAELGTTWFTLIRRPVDAAHVLGKLLLAVGEDNVLWGTDSIWYGPSQAAIDAFRAFEIPVSFQQRYGYPALTAEVKEKVLAKNAARVYGIDLNGVLRAAAGDELAGLRAAREEYLARGYLF